MIVCENCGRRTKQLAPCPCGLNNECPITDGVCAHCRNMIARNARERARQGKAS